MNNWNNNNQHNIRLGRRRGKEGYVCKPYTLARPAVQQADKITHNSLTHSSQVTGSEQNKLQRVLDKFGSVFSNKPTTTNVYEHKIQITDENKFVRKTYPIPLHYQQQVDEEVRKMLESGVVERTDSNFLNPMVVVKKKNNDIRLCLDMRNLITITKKCYDCALNVENLFVKCQGVKYMLSLIHI